MRLKGYVSGEYPRQVENRAFYDYGFDSDPRKAISWETAAEAEGACRIFERRGIRIPSADGGDHICSGFKIESLENKFVVFCEAPFIPRS